MSANVLNRVAYYSALASREDDRRAKANGITPPAFVASPGSAEATGNHAGHRHQELRQIRETPLITWG